MSDSARWCEKCQAHGDHHTDRHPSDDDYRLSDAELNMCAHYGMGASRPLAREVQELRQQAAELRAEVERLTEERDDHKARLAIEAVTAPDADYDTMMDSLQARIRDLWAEVERLTAENADLRAINMACNHDALFAERALADQLAETLRESWQLDATTLQRFVAHRQTCVALAAWEAARHE